MPPLCRPTNRRHIFIVSVMCACCATSELDLWLERPQGGAREMQTRCSSSLPSHLFGHASTGPCRYFLSMAFSLVSLFVDSRLQVLPRRPEPRYGGSASHGVLLCLPFSTHLLRVFLDSSVLHFSIYAGGPLRMLSDSRQFLERWRFCHVCEVSTNQHQVPYKKGATLPSVVVPHPSLCSEKESLFLPHIFAFLLALC
jgi:hypothetical protein